MKKLNLLLLGISLFCSTIIYAQQSGNSYGMSYYDEQFPEFKGNLNRFIKKNIQYPNEALNAKIEGQLVVQFIVYEDGSIDSNKISIVKSLGFGLDEEAIRLVKLMPKWIPGKQNGKPVVVKCSLPIRFKLPSN